MLNFEGLLENAKDFFTVGRGGGIPELKCASCEETLADEEFYSVFGNIVKGHSQGLVGNNLSKQEVIGGDYILTVDKVQYFCPACLHTVIFKVADGICFDGLDKSAAPRSGSL